MSIQIMKNKELKCELQYIVVDNQPWFRGFTIAKALGYKNPSQSLVDNVRSKHKQKYRALVKNPCSGFFEDGLKPATMMVSEPGLYSLIMHSKMKKAENFQDWVYEQVLPSIRKTGSYTVTQNNDMLLKIEMQKAENDKLRLELEDKKLELEEKKYMKELFDEDDDVKLKAAAKDYLLMKLTGKVQTEDRWARDITEIAKDEFGINLNHTQKCQVGKFIKKKYMDEFDTPIHKTKRWVNGSMRNVNVYPKDKEQWMIDALRNWGNE